MAPIIQWRPNIQGYALFFRMEIKMYSCIIGMVNVDIRKMVIAGYWRQWLLQGTYQRLKTGG
jgi:hypothetical protein